MQSNSSDELQRRLNLARNGGGILFCGAGFSADCLNFKPDETLGTSAQLLNLFNSKLCQDPPFGNLQNAAEALREQIADHGMERLLKGRYTVSNVTQDMTVLLRYPWQAVYTTNYDNALEIAAHAAHIQTESLNNTDDPNTHSINLPIIHLHGYVQKWNINNIRESCVLGAKSYLELTQVKKWFPRFRSDIDQAQIVVFVGFNADDFHLNQAVFDLTGLREKAFFINLPTAEADPDVTAAQKRLGTPFFIGRDGLAAKIKALLTKDAPKEPHLASFTKYTPPVPAATVPTQAQIEDLFLYGKVEPSQIARDLSNDISDYHIQRSAIQETMDAIAGDARIVLLEGYPCDGKTLLTTDLAYRLSGERPVYQMRKAYENMLDEVADVLHHAPNAALIIENCFDLPEARLASIVRQFKGQEGVLILTSRGVAIDASPTGIVLLEDLDNFRKMPLDQLDESEARVLIDLVHQISGWRHFYAHDPDARQRFIQKTLQASLPSFLMEFLRSEYVTDRYREEFSKLSLDQTERAVIIVALYFSHIGQISLVSLLSNAMERDCGAIIDRLDVRSGNDTFRLVRRTGETIQTVPSIGAKNILRNIFTDAEIVDAIIPLLKRFAVIYRNPLEQHVFSQLMRFSHLSKVVTDGDEIDRFFEHNKQELQIRRFPLFWLQWHLAKCKADDLPVAEKLLEQGYGEAAEFERRTGKTFDRRQLDDRRAKFLMLRANKTRRAGEDLSRDFKDAIDLTHKTLRRIGPRRFPFETLAEIVKSYSEVSHKLDDMHKKLIYEELDGLINYARKRVHALPSRYQRDKAQSALARCSGLGL